MHHTVRREDGPITAELSHSLYHATEAARQFIAAQALKDLVGSGPVRKPKRTEPEQEAPRRKGRGHSANPWRQPVDFRFPAPAEGRPVTVGGGSTFHCRMTPLSKARAGDMTMTKGAGSSLDAAARHDLYVSGGRSITPPDAASVDRYIADARIEVSPHEPVPSEGSRVALLLSSISPDAAMRSAFWDGRWQAASMPGDPVIELRPERGSAEQWKALLADETLPEALRQRLAEALDRPADAAPAQPKAAEEAGPPVMREVRLETDAETIWAEGLAQRFRARGRSKYEIMIHYRRPRAGLVQLRFEFELPAGLSLRDVERIARRTATIFEELGLPHTLAVHRPDALNDPRNWHIHVVAYPGRGLRAADGRWSFPRGVAGVGKIRPGDIAVAFGDSHAKDASMPYRQRADRDVGRLRHAYADICNEVLREGGHPRRFDARSYEEMGIAREPTEHLGSSEARLVAAGISTEADGRNMVRSWRGELTQLMMAVADRFAPMKDVLITIPGGDGASGATPDAQRLLARQRELDRRLEDMRDGAKRLAKFDIHARMACSGAARSIRNTDRLMAAISANEASKADAANLPFIVARHRLAQGHLAEIDAALDPWAVDVETFRQRLDRDTEILRADIDQWWAEARAWSTKAAGVTVEKPRPRATAERPAVIVATVQEATSRTPLPTPPRACHSLTLTHVLDRIRREHLHVDRIIENGRTGHDVLGLTDEEAALITDIRHADRVSKALDAFASNQTKRIGDLVRLIEAKGWDAVVNGVREGTQAPNADAVLLARYKDHPGFQREVGALVPADLEEQGLAVGVAASPHAAAAPSATAAQPAIVDAPDASTEVVRPIIGVPSSMAPRTSVADQDHDPIVPRSEAKAIAIPAASTPEPPPASSAPRDDLAAAQARIDGVATDRHQRPVPVVAGPQIVREPPRVSDAIKVRPAARGGPSREQQEPEGLRVSHGKAEPISMPATARDEARSAPDLGSDVTAPGAVPPTPLEPTAAGRETRRDTVAKAPPAAFDVAKRKPSAMDIARAAAAGRTRPGVGVGDGSVPNAATPKPSSSGKPLSAPSPSTPQTGRGGRNTGTSGLPDRTPPAARRDLRYPDPRDAATRQVRAFIALLHEGAPADQLRAAAEAIAREPAADQDVRRHRIELRDAYLDHLKGPDPFDPSRRRGQGVGRS